jgi:hypothetical protein
MVKSVTNRVLATHLSRIIVPIFGLRYPKRNKTFLSGTEEVGIYFLEK